MPTIWHFVLPCNTDGLWHLQRCYERFPVYASYLIDAESRSDQYQRRLEVSVRTCDLHKAFFVYVWSISGRVYAKFRAMSIYKRSGLFG